MAKTSTQRGWTRSRSIDKAIKKAASGAGIALTYMADLERAIKSDIYGGTMDEWTILCWIEHIGRLARDTAKMAEKTKAFAEKRRHERWEKRINS